MLLSLPTVLFDNILSRLDLKSKRLLTRSSKKLAKDIWGRLPTVRARYSQKDFTHAMSMFQKVESILPTDPLIRQMTNLMRNSYRNTALRNWINEQIVCIDAGGFYTPNRGYVITDMRRIRIKMWDRPLGTRLAFYNHGGAGGWETVQFLRREFMQMGYDP
jgi:hypothetical protein